MDKRLGNYLKVYEIENLSEIESDSSVEMLDIDDYLYSDEEEEDSFIPTDFNDKKTLQKFLQREIDFYSTAFPHATLSEKFLRYIIILLNF